MDNHIFRSAALGFNRQDVMEYIEKTQKEAEANAASLSRRLDEAMEELARLRLRLEERGEEAEKNDMSTVPKYVFPVCLRPKMFRMGNDPLTLRTMS